MQTALRHLKMYATVTVAAFQYTASERQTEEKLEPYEPQDWPEIRVTNPVS